MSDLPEPLVPADVDLRNFPYMPLHVVRLRDSGIAARASGEEFRAAVLLWCAAWHQQPAASLPDDDAELAHLAGLGRAPKEWRKVRAGALRGWVKCSDGRLYHPVVAEVAVDSWEAKRKQRERTAAATEARRARQAQRDDPRNEQRNVDRDERRDVQRDESRDDQRRSKIAHTKGIEGKGIEEKRSTTIEEGVSDPHADDAKRLTALFKELRLLKWPHESAFPAPDLTLETQAAQLLALPGSSFDLLAEVLRREVDRDDRDAPASFLAYHKTFRGAAQRHGRPMPNGAVNGHAPERPTDPSKWTLEQQRAAMELFARDGTWHPQWGPHHPRKDRPVKGCPIAPEIQREFGYGGNISDVPTRAGG